MGMPIKIYNLDAEFETYLKKWMAAHANDYGGNLDRLEEMVPDVYMDFLDEPMALLGDVSPRKWFEQISDPATLMVMLEEYMSEQVPVPDLLLERIVELGDGTQPYLLEMIRNAALPEEARMTAVSLMQEIGSDAPMDDYIRLIASLEEASDMGDICAESLISMGQQVVEPVLAVYDSASNAARNIFADILCNFRGDDRIYRILAERFLSQKDMRALFASYLAKYEDERALPMLIEASADMSLGYLDFLEIANAIEALGGERPSEREYAGDPYYEALSRI